METTTTVSETDSTASKSWSPVQVYTMAAICLIVGVAVGYLFRGSESKTPSPPPTAQAQAGAPQPQQMPSLDDMKRMADKQAEPLLAKLKADPNNSDLLNQVGMTYKATHQFKEAVAYFQKAVEANPKNTAARTDLATCLYYEGDTDGAIKQLEESLTYDPKDVNSLFNLGMIRWKGKNDAKGAVEAWNQLLKANPQISSDQKTQVQELLAEAKKQATKL